ncbi:LacI family DNA-binding transcriptional regulator [Longirhabdus pacifica]|uniref:LacI family DNA-binding transcriptional regulator n=1 Tax=Longirhabdus pacifica TaxID=2305227 RepID=UPI001008F34E|nr:LacI family DNA-binding transcriptional regulator [Longirhabdus pacifica]
MPVTIKDVAKEAGVSPSTVSRVISNHPRISPQTTAKVKKIMDELGYHPNMLAKSLVMQKSKTLGIILPRPAEELFVNLFFSEFIRGIVAQASRIGYDLLMTSGVTQMDEADAITKLVKGKKVDGIIILTSRKKDPVIKLLQEMKFPFVVIGRSDEFENILSVDNDNIKAATDVTNYLISIGHKRIGFVSGPAHLIVSQDRLTGYTEALKAAQLETKPEWIVEGEFLQESGYLAMSSIMSLENRPSALIVTDDLVAYGVLRGLTELGYKVPEDISIISFNNITISELTNPPLNSVEIGIYQMGYTASQLLIRSIEDGVDSKRELIPHRIITRQSCAPLLEK